MAWLDDSEPEESDEQSADEQKVTRLTAFYIGLALSPVMILFGYLGRFDLGLNVFICLCVNIAAIRMRWKLRKYPWLWCVMAIVLALEVPAVLMIQWPRGWVPAVALLPIALVGLMIALGAIQLAEKLFGKPDSSEED